MNVLNTVEFEPPLSEVKRTASAERHAGAGRKCYVRVKGDVGNVSVLAPEAQAVNYVVTYARDDEGSWLVVFSSIPERLPMSGFDDVAGMQDALQPFLPGVEVERIIGWDWANDPLALGTWCIYRPGQLARVLPELRATEGLGCSFPPAATRRSRGAPPSTGRSIAVLGARHIDDYLTAGGQQARSAADLARPVGV